MLKPILIGFVIGFTTLVLLHWTYGDPTAFSQSAAIATNTEAVDLGVDGRPDSYLKEMFRSGIRPGLSRLFAFDGWHMAAVRL